MENDNSFYLRCAMMFIGGIILMSHPWIALLCFLAAYKKVVKP